MSALVDGFRPGQLPAGARALRDAVRDFLADNLPAPAPEVRARSWMDSTPASAAASPDGDGSA